MEWMEADWTQPRITRSKDEARSILEGYQAKIKSGEESLGSLAKRESDCNSAHKFGDLGCFGRGVMQREFEDAAFALEVGQLSDVVETASGLHLIERLDPPSLVSARILSCFPGARGERLAFTNGVTGWGKVSESLAFCVPLVLGLLRPR